MTTPGRARRVDLLVAGSCAIGAAVLLGLVFSDRRFAPRVDQRDRGDEIGEVIARTNQVRRRGYRSLVWRDLGPSARVYPNDIVYVGTDSAATIHLSDGSLIDFDEASLVAIGQPQVDAAETATTRVDILRGGVSGIAGGHLDLRADSTATRLRRRATVVMRVGQDRSIRVTAKRGEASVVTASGVAALTEGEHQTIDAKGRTQVSRAAIALHTPEDGARVYLNPSTGALHFGWGEVEGRGSYRFQVALDAEFSRLAFETRVKRPSATVSNLDAGVHYWRVVRGTSTSDEHRLVLIDDRPPVPYRPQAESVVDLSQAPSLSLAWGGVPDVNHYRVELARGYSFQTPLYSLQTDRPSHILRSTEVVIEEGRHCLRVRADEPERSNSPWSAVVCFRIVAQPALRAPVEPQPVGAPGI